MRTSTLVLSLALVASACATPNRNSSSAVTAPNPPPSVATSSGSAVNPGAATAQPGDLKSALVDLNGALAAVRPGSVTPLWTIPDAVASADGTKAIGVKNGKLAGYAIATGETTGTWPLPPGSKWRVAVVDRTGSRAVLTDGLIDANHRVTTSRLAIWERAHPDTPKLITQPGALEPEAISPDGQRLFVLDHRDKYYRVRTVSLSDNQIFDTFGRDKSPAEDMNGEPVRAVLSPDGNTLSTLYRVPGGGHQPFVHVLSLEYGWSYCADLPDGTYGSMTPSLDGETLYIGGADGSWLTLDLRTFDEPGAGLLPIELHRTGTSPLPLAPRGAVVSPRGIAAADATGVSWYAGDRAVAHVDLVVDRLVTLAA
jgi:hypothetical protein